LTSSARAPRWVFSCRRPQKRVPRFFARNGHRSGLERRVNH